MELLVELNKTILCNLKILERYQVICVHTSILDFYI